MKWDHFKRAKLISKSCQSYELVFLRSFRSFQIGTANLCRLKECVRAALVQYLGDGIILKF